MLKATYAVGSDVEEDLPLETAGRSGASRCVLRWMRVLIERLPAAVEEESGEEDHATSSDDDEEAPARARGAKLGPAATQASLASDKSFWAAVEASAAKGKLRAYTDNGTQQTSERRELRAHRS